MKATTKRYVTYGVMALVVVILLAVAFAPKPTPVDIAEVHRGPLRVTLEEEGETRVRDRFTVSAPVAGQVLRIELEPGDPVTAGETVLATFSPSDPNPLDARSRREAQAQVRAARAAVEQAQAERERAASEAELAATELQRAERLAEQGIVSAEQLDIARNRARTSREAARSAEFAVSTARYELERARALLTSGTGTGANGDVISLTSPVDGVVLERFRESAAVVPAGEPLLEVADTSRLEIVSDFLSHDAVRIDPGQRALIEHWGGDEILEARVRRVEPSGFTKISALGVEEQRVNVILDVVDPRTAWEELGDGYRVEVAVVLWEGDDVLQAPTSALFRHGQDGQDGWAVFRIEGDAAILTPIEVGRRTALAAEIVSGLSEGDRVIVHPSDSIQDGTEVESREVR